MRKVHIKNNMKTLSSLKAEVSVQLTAVNTIDALTLYTNDGQEAKIRGA